MSNTVPRHYADILHHFSGVFILCLTVSTCPCPVEAERPTHDVLGEGTSYLGVWKRASEHLKLVTSLNNNPALRHRLDQIAAKLSTVSTPPGLTNYGEMDTLPEPLSEVVVNVLERGRGFQAALPSQCANDTGRMLTGLLNRTDWAIQMFDSIGKPGPSLSQGRFNWVGNYDQCLKVYAPPDEAIYSGGFHGAYTVLFYQIQLRELSLMGLPAMWGVCLPDTCDEAEIDDLLSDAFQYFNLSTMGVTFVQSEIRSDYREFTTATYAAIIVLSIIVCLMLSGTLYDLLVIQRRSSSGSKVGPIGPEPSNDKHNNGVIEQNGSHKSGEALGRWTEPGILAKIILAFSVYTNTSKFLSTAQPPGSLGAIHGIRFLSMSWVILGHTWVFGVPYLVNTSDIIMYAERWTFDAISNALVSVDTFFTLSGVLTAYLTIKEMKKKNWNINWGRFYFHRFWRLTPPYMLALLCVLGLQRFWGSGAIWQTIQPQDKANCDDNWWTNLLYVNNIVKADRPCFGHGWFLANDMQFFLVSPLMLVPFYFHTYAGLTSCAVFLLTNWIAAGVISTNDELTSVIFDAGKGVDVGDDLFGLDYYQVPWCRIGPFVVGIATGYFLAIYKGRIPMNRVANVLGWTVSTAAALAVVYGLRGDITGDAPNSVAVRAFYNAVARSAWGASVCWVIVSCTSGYGGVVNSILSWSPFVVLGRLTYMAYLIHPSIIATYFMNMDQTFFVNDLNNIVSYLGLLALANLAAFVSMLALESPMIGLEKALLPRG